MLWRQVQTGLVPCGGVLQAVVTAGWILLTGVVVRISVLSEEGERLAS
jgi:hypothetical protein